MAVGAKCRIHECPFEFEDADHAEDAIAKLRAHFRTEHPTKVFRQREYEDYFEAYNCTLDEALGGFLGPNWREHRESRQIVHACQQVCRYRNDYRREVIEGARALAREHGREIPDPFDDANNDVAQQDNDFLDYVAPPLID